MWYIYIYTHYIFKWLRQPATDPSCENSVSPVLLSSFSPGKHLRRAGVEEGASHLEAPLQRYALTRVSNGASPMSIHRLIKSYGQITTGIPSSLVLYGSGSIPWTQPKGIVFALLFILIVPTFGCHIVLVRTEDVIENSGAKLPIYWCVCHLPRRVPNNAQTVQDDPKLVPRGV